MRTFERAARLQLTGLVVGLLAIAGALPAVAGAASPTLFDRIGIGADWGPHWATSPAASDPRDTQADGAFPAEVCLLRNAGFKTIRMYGENAATWLAVLDAVDDYNGGKLKCYEAGPGGGGPIAGERRFTDSLDEELVKLKQVLANAGAKFSSNVSLVLVGNEVLFSRGVCSNGGAACTDTRDCGGGTCGIGHYCSDQLSGPTPPAQCASSATCSHQASCTDVTNLDPLKYAFGQVQHTLALLPGAKPPISISLQMDLLVSPSFGDDPKTASLMWSRQQLGQALPNPIIAANTYPDQWGQVTVKQIPTTCEGGSFPSCVGASNAVQGKALLAACADDSAYRDPVTGKIAHTIDNYFTRLRSYYAGFDLMIAETGWHTAGTCSAYNDCLSTYSAGDAATYYQDLYAYVQNNKIPLLAFQPFDQKTKVCDRAGNGEMAEANYGVFNNVCQLKGPGGGNQALLPPAGPGSLGPNLAAFNALLDEDGSPSTKSCRPETLVVVTGVGSTGICEHNTGIACLAGYTTGDPAASDKCPPGPGGSNNRCVWGYCASAPSVGCNPGDPGNAATCGECKRAGNCFSLNEPAGIFSALVDCAGKTCIAACTSDQSCDGAKAPFTDTGKCGQGGNMCGCFAAMAPSTLPGGTGNTTLEAPGFALAYGNGKGGFAFAKTRTLAPEIISGPRGFEVTAVWANAFLGKDWTLQVVNPPGTTVRGSACGANTVTALNVADPKNPSLTWDGNWSACNYPPAPVNADKPTQIVFPRGYLTSVPKWPRLRTCAIAPSPTSACEEPTTVSFESTSGKAQNVGVAKDGGNVRIAGRFIMPDALRLDAATLTLGHVLFEEASAGELIRGAAAAPIGPVSLGARSGSKPQSAVYETPAGARPSFKVEVKTRDAKTGLTEFSITVDRATIPAGPSHCSGSPTPSTAIETSFTIDDGAASPLLVSATLPWQCRVKELRRP